MPESDREKLIALAKKHGLTFLLQAGSPDDLEPLWPQQCEDLYYVLEDYGIRIEFQPGDFTQVNTEINRNMISRAIEKSFAGESEDTAPKPKKRHIMGGRVELNVGFVRQHYATCAPATLAAICRYWGHPFDHLEVAESICYDGTPDHNERHWVEEHGFLAREFRVTWESSQALIDAGSGPIFLP